MVGQGGKTIRIYTCVSLQAFEKFKTRTGNQIVIASFSPFLKDKLIELEQFFINLKNDILVLINDTVVLDYVPAKVINFINDDGVAVPFAEIFSDQLEIMHPGEVILNSLTLNEEQELKFSDLILKVCKQKAYSQLQRVGKYRK